jgi:hypothetical protein
MITREDVKACADKPLTEEQINTVIHIVSNNEYLMQTINECIVEAIGDLPYVSQEQANYWKKS